MRDCLGVYFGTHEWEKLRLGCYPVWGNVPLDAHSSLLPGIFNSPIYYLTILGQSEFPRRRRWHPTPVLLPGKSHGWRSLVGCSPWVAKSWTWLSDFTFNFHFHALEKEMETHSSVLAWRIPGIGEPDGLPSMGSHRVGHDWSDLAAAAAAAAADATWLQQGIFSLKRREYSSRAVF